MPTFDCPRILAAARADPEFNLAARFWDGDLRLEAGDEAVVLEMRGGKAADLGPAAAATSSPAIRVAATPEQWREMLAPVPRPFYQDVNAAVFHHGVTLDAPVTEFGPHYRAIARLIELMREPGSN